MVSNFSRPGAIDLSSLGSTPPASSAPAGGGQFVVDVTDQSFQAEVIDRSRTVPVVIDFWADWCGPCKQLSPVLEKLATEYAGAFVLAKIDVDANPQIAQAAQVQSIPMVIGVVAGQVVPLFMGAVPEAQVRQYLDQLVAAAQQNGVTGTAEPMPGGDQVPTEPAEDPRYDEAYAAIERGDWAAAKAAYTGILNELPNDPTAAAGLAQVGLLARVSSLPADALAQADADPTDAARACDAADLLVAQGDVSAAFDRLLAVVRGSTGEDRTTARGHLLELFAVVGADDPRVATARTALANALF